MVSNFLTIGREQLFDRLTLLALSCAYHDRTKSQIEAGDRAIWKPDFNKGQLLPAVLILEKLNIVHFLTPGIMFRGGVATVEGYCGAASAYYSQLFGGLGPKHQNVRQELQH